MKKILLTGSALFAAATVFAAVPVQEFAGLAVTDVSPEGKYIASDQGEGIVTIINLETGEEHSYSDPEGMTYFSMGIGNALGTGGKAVGNIGETPCVFHADGTYTPLELPYPEMGGSAYGITPDGIRICGTVGLAPITFDAKVPMRVPAVWELQPDGTYGSPTILPHPDTDFAGAVPQYITANYISENGRVVLGNIRDNIGQITTLVYFVLNDENHWECHNEFAKLANPDNIEIPPYPEEGPMMPTMEDYMTPEQLAAYQAAYQAWLAEGTWDPATEPKPEDYLSEEGRQQYNQAVEEYNIAAEKFNKELEAFSIAYMKCIEDGLILEYNGVKLSSDGNLAVSATFVEVEDPTSFFGRSIRYTPVTFDLRTGNYVEFPNKNIFPTSIADDGTILGYTETSVMPRQAMVYKPGEVENPISLFEYMQVKDPVTYTWMQENMRHDYEYYTYDDEGKEIPHEVKDYEFSGTPIADGDLSVICCAVANVWDNAGALYYSYALPVSSNTNGIGCIKNMDSSVSIAAQKGGRIIVDGAVSEISIYDAEGRLVWNGAGSGAIETGLGSGLYLIRATTAEGTRTVKALF